MEPVQDSETWLDVITGVIGGIATIAFFISALTVVIGLCFIDVYSPVINYAVDTIGISVVIAMICVCISKRRK